MANGSIKITILGSGDGSGTGGGQKKKEKTSGDIMMDNLKKIMHPIKTTTEGVEQSLIGALGGGGGAVMAVGLGVKLVSDAASEVFSIAMMEHNRYFTLREDYIGQNKMSMLQTQMNTSKALLSSITSGALAGAATGLATGNPLVIAAGAVIGGVSSGVKTGLDMRIQRDQKIEQYNMQLNATNAQTQFMASRASLINGGRGTEY